MKSVLSVEDRDGLLHTICILVKMLTGCTEMSMPCHEDRDKCRCMVIVQRGLNRGLSPVRPTRRERKLGYRER